MNKNNVTRCEKNMFCKKDWRKELPAYSSGKKHSEEKLRSKKAVLIRFSRTSLHINPISRMRSPKLPFTKRARQKTWKCTAECGLSAFAPSIFLSHKSDIAARYKWTTVLESQGQHPCMRQAIRKVPRECSRVYATHFFENDIVY